MTETPSAPSRLRSLSSTLAHSPTALWAAFILTHLWLGFQNFTDSGLPLGDVIIQYKGWAQSVDLASYYVGIDKAWVYPIVALIPMVIAGVFGWDDYAGTWLALVFVLDLVAFAAMVGWRRPHRPVAIGWWWIAFLLLLGPIAMGRIDSISVPLAIVGVLFLASRPRLAAVLLALATWIKVWPAAIVLAVVIAARHRLAVFLSVIVTSGIIVAAALALGSGANVFSFVTQQTSRGLQVESPVSTIWMWLSFAHVGGSFPYYDQEINTFEVLGPGSSAVAALLTPLLGLVVIVVAILGIVAVQRGASVTELLAPLSLALVTAFIAFNKVGSPQYMTWLAVPIILGIAVRSRGHGRSFRFPAVAALVIAGFTQLFYPVFYDQLLELQAPLLIVLTARNILVLALFAWSVGVVVDIARPFTSHELVGEGDSWLPAPWTFAQRHVSDDDAPYDASPEPEPEQDPAPS